MMTLLNEHSQLQALAATPGGTGEVAGWFMTCLYIYGFIGGIQCNVQVEQRNAEDELNACRDHLSRSVASSGRADHQCETTGNRFP